MSDATTNGSEPPPPPVKGVTVIETALATMPLSPGVYRMLDATGQALYVGKARSLKKRVTSYTQVARLDERLRRMVSETVAMEIITTHTEAEALLLEANLIKRLKPRFNIVLRDDKSYPWLMLTEDHAFPQLVKHRGAHTRKGTYWGPFASAWSVNQTVTAMERVFLLRSCADTVFSARTRPCLLHQIKRCSAPCVDRISAEEYGKLVAQAKAFLSGKAAHVQRELSAEMQTAADNMEYERAAALRDRIRGLTHVQGGGVINPASLEDADIVALWQQAGQSCVQVFFVRGGRNNGNRAHFPTHARNDEPGDVLAAFLALVVISMGSAVVFCIAALTTGLGPTSDAMIHPDMATPASYFTPSQIVYLALNAVISALVLPIQATPAAAMYAALTASAPPAAPVIEGGHYVPAP